MKIIILNGSPKGNGNTATALHEVERSREYRPSRRSHRHDGRAEQVFPEDEYARCTVIVLEHCPRHRSRRGDTGRRGHADHAPARSEHCVPHQVHPSRTSAVRFAEDSGRANRNALYQIMRRIL